LEEVIIPLDVLPNEIVSGEHRGQTAPVGIQAGHLDLELNLVVEVGVHASGKSDIG
jgi:hypothetical protein